MTLRSRLARLRQNKFARSVGVLVGGTAFSQAIVVAVLPLLTRLSTPEDFSILAVYVSLLGMFSIAACFRLDIAIPLPEHDNDAVNVMALALLGSALVAFIMALAVAYFPLEIIGLIKQPKLKPYLWLLPVGVLLASSYGALQYWATRKKDFSTVAKTRIAQAVAGAGTQLGLSLAGVLPFGLLLGHTITGGAGALGLAYKLVKNDRSALAAITWPTMRKVLRQYERFPKYSTLDALANSAGMQLPIILIAAWAVGPEAGFLMLAMRVMQAPMALIGGSVAQVYLSRAPDEQRAGTLTLFTLNILNGLIKTGVGPLIFAGMIAPYVFALIFGENWRRAGDLVTWMIPWFVLQYVSSPVSMALLVTNRQITMLLLTLTGLVLRVGAVSVAIIFLPTNVSEFYVVGSAVYYFLVAVVVFRSVNLEYRAVGKLVLNNYKMVLSWVLAGGIVSGIFRYAIWYS